jgi:hypothetical protein
MASFTTTNDGSGNASDSETVTCPTLTYNSAESQQVHGGAGTFSINLPLVGTPGVECRNGSTPGNYTIVLTFSNAISTVDNVATSCGSVASSGVDGGNPNNFIVQLSSVTCNQQDVTVSLTGVNDVYAQTLASADATMGLLIGDTTGDGSVNSADISQTKSRSGQAVSSANFRSDVTVDGSLNSADISLVKSKSGTALP